MATPILTVQNKNQSIIQTTPQKLIWDIKDADGAPKDISSGFTAQMQHFFSSSQDAKGGQVVDGTWTYGADGKLTLTLTMAQSEDVHTGNWPYIVNLSNDSFTTVAQGARGTLVVTGGIVFL